MTRKRPPIKPNLSGLLGDTAALGRPAAPSNTLPIDGLRAGSFQPRRTFDERALSSLAASIREQGMLQPLLVRPVGEGHEIVAGERRWRAAQLAGLTEVPVIIRDLNDREARAAGLVENIQRENLNVIDEVDAKLDLAALALNLSREEARARLIRLVKEEHGEEAEVLTALFAPLGETWASFAKNKLRILGWPEAVLSALREGLPFTLAGIVAAASEEHHTRLLDLARSGATRAELQAEVGRLKETVTPSTLNRVNQLGRRLTSRRALARLDDRQLRRLEQWLEKMPADVKVVLESEV